MSIVVIGGYGAVGSVTALILGDRYPGEVVAAGRYLEKAEILARSSGGAVRAARVDVGDPADVDRLLDGAAVVVMCVEQANAAVAEACLRRGIRYVDITATMPIIRQISRLDTTAHRYGATAALSVGVAPGLTNLLAHQCLDQLPSARTVDISLLLGMGGDHGAGSLRWIAEQLATPAQGSPMRVPLGEWGTRKVHPFAFSDQYTISEQAGVRATTRICFDSALVTSALFGLRAAGVFGLVRRLRAERLLASAFGRIHLGSDRFAVHVSASDGEGGVVTRRLSGRDTCHATGVVTALVAATLYESPAPPGVHHIEHLVEPESFLADLTRHDMTVESRPPSPAS
jgi:hypothetical protein